MELAPAHPARLGVAFNFSVFFDEVMQAPQQAAEVATSALERAESDTANRERFKESNMVIRMLKDNLANWSRGLLRGTWCVSLSLSHITQMDASRT